MTAEINHGRLKERYSAACLEHERAARELLEKRDLFCGTNWIVDNATGVLTECLVWVTGQITFTHYTPSHPAYWQQMKFCWDNPALTVWH